MELAPPILRFSLIGGRKKNNLRKAEINGGKNQNGKREREMRIDPKEKHKRRLNWGTRGKAKKEIRKKKNQRKGKM